jgi:hypothetical protein
VCCTQKRAGGVKRKRGSPGEHRMVLEHVGSGPDECCGGLFGVTHISPVLGSPVFSVHMTRLQIRGGPFLYPLTRGNRPVLWLGAFLIQQFEPGQEWPCDRKMGLLSCS